MADVKSFRTALRGFNRNDVVAYIEYLTNKYNSQIEQLNNQLAAARQAAASSADTEALEARCAALEAELEQYRNAGVPTESDELEVYRRAERTEREARERAAQIYAQTNAVLADATQKVDTATGEMAAQLQNCIAAADAAKALLQDAAQAMNAIRPEE